MTVTHFYINKEWIVSPTARRVYRVAAAFSICLIPLIIVVNALGADLVRSPLMRALFTQVMFLCVLGGALTSVAMEYFFFGFDDLENWRKVGWFFILCLIPVGPALYCYRVYSSSKYFQPMADDAGVISIDN